MRSGEKCSLGGTEPFFEKQIDGARFLGLSLNIYLPVDLSWIQIEGMLGWSFKVGHQEGRKLGIGGSDEALGPWMLGVVCQKYMKGVKREAQADLPHASSSHVVPGEIALSFR